MTTKKRNRFAEYNDADKNPLGVTTAELIVPESENTTPIDETTPATTEEVIVDAAKENTEPVEEKVVEPEVVESEEVVQPEVEAPKEEVKVTEPLPTEKQEEPANNSGQEVNQETGEIIQAAPKHSLEKEKTKRINSGSFYIEENLDLVLLYLKKKYKATKSDIIEKALKAYLTTAFEIQEIVEDDEVLSELIKNIK